MNYQHLENVFDYAADQAETSDIEVLDGVDLDKQVQSIEQCKMDVYEAICMPLVYAYDYYVTNKEVLDSDKLQKLEWLFAQNRATLTYSFHKYIEMYQLTTTRNADCMWINNVDYDTASLLIKLIEMLKWEDGCLFYNDDDTYSVRYREVIYNDVQ